MKLDVEAARCSRHARGIKQDGAGERDGLCTPKDGGVERDNLMTRYGLGLRLHVARDGDICNSETHEQEGDNPHPFH